MVADGFSETGKRSSAVYLAMAKFPVFGAREKSS
jgi:hypothetical protein